MKYALLKACIASGIEVLPLVAQMKSWPLIDDMPWWCEQLGLTWYGAGEHTIVSGEPLVVIWKIAPGKAHAEYTTDIRHFLHQDILGVIGGFGRDWPGLIEGRRCLPLAGRR